MPKPRNLGSNKIIKILGKFGFRKVSQKGSHIKLVRQLTTNRQVLVIPYDNDLPKGTIRAIYSQATRYISKEELDKDFYN